MKRNNRSFSSVPRHRCAPLHACAWLACLTIGSAVATRALFAERILLKHGQQVDGKVLREPNDADGHYVIQLRDGVHVRLASDEIGRIDRLSELEKAYAKWLREMPDTARGHFVMARWCHENELKDQKDLHLRNVIRHDPDHVEARKMLGHVFRRGKWAPSEAHMEAQGYQRHRGNLRLPQQIAMEKKQREIELAQKNWTNEIKRWRGWLGGRRDAAARKHIRMIEDPLAAPALFQLLREEDNAEVRRLYLEVLSRLTAPEAHTALVHTALYDDDVELRIKAIDALKQRNPRRAVSDLVSALSDTDNGIVQRAARALGRIGDPEAIRPLIGALVTTHQFVVKPRGNMRTSFGGTSDGGIGFNGLNVGGGPKTVQRQLENRAVLEALVELTGKNFRFSVADWNRWYVEQHSMPADVNLRRDS